VQAGFLGDVVESEGKLCGSITEIKISRHFTTTFFIIRKRS
jgi:hypothetical protein